MYYQAAHMNIHRQNISSIKKKWNVHVGGFWFVEFYSARVFLCSGVGSFSVQIRQKYTHPSVVLGWGVVLSFVLNVGSTKLFSNHEERDTSLFKIRSLLLLTVKLNKTDQTQPKKSSINFFPFPLWIAYNVILPFWLNGGTLIRTKL